MVPAQQTPYWRGGHGLRADEARHATEATPTSRPHCTMNDIRYLLRGWLGETTWPGQTRIPQCTGDRSQATATGGNSDHGDASDGHWAWLGWQGKQNRMAGVRPAWPATGPSTWGVAALDRSCKLWHDKVHRLLSPLGCDSDTTACCQPLRGWQAALGPTRSRVARHERKCDSDV